MSNEERIKKIAGLNDLLRTTMLPGTGRVVMTTGFAALENREEFITAIRQFNVFTTDNDPHGEHDFGVVKIGGTKVFWKIDYYDSKYEYGSEDAADPAKTGRLLTMMLAEEY